MSRSRRPARILFDTAMRGSPDHAHWLGTIEIRPYALRGRHQYLVHVPRLALLSLGLAVGMAGLAILGHWVVRYRPLDAGIGPIEAAATWWSGRTRTAVSQRLTAQAQALLRENQGWRAHDQLVRALELDSRQFTARTALARHLESERFGSQANAILISGLREISAGAPPDEDFLLYATQRLRVTGDYLTLTSLVPAAFARLPAAATPSPARQTIAREVVHSWLELGQHPAAIAFAREHGFVGDEFVGASQLQVRELLDQQRYDEASRLIEDLQSGAAPTPATSLLLIESALGKGDTAGALRLAEHLSSQTLGEPHQLALLSLLHKALKIEEESVRTLAQMRQPDPSRTQLAQQARAAYDRQVDRLFDRAQSTSSLARLARFLGDAPDSASLRRLSPRLGEDTSHVRLWSSALIDALMAEGDIAGAMRNFLEHQGGRHAQADDINTTLQASLLYYLDFSSAPLVEELGRQLGHRSAGAGAYLRAARTLARNHRWDGARRIASLGLGLYPGNLELRAELDAISRDSAQLGRVSSAPPPAQLDRMETIQQIDNYLAERNAVAALTLLRHVETLRPLWRADAEETLAWQRVQTVFLLGQPALALAAAGDYTGADYRRARRLFEWASLRAGEGISAGWLTPLASLFHARFPELPTLGRWRRVGAPVAGAEQGQLVTPEMLLGEFDALHARGSLEDAMSLLESMLSDSGFPPERRGELIRLEMVLAATRGDSDKSAAYATDLLRRAPHQVQAVLNLAVSHVTLAEKLASVVRQEQPDALRFSPQLQTLLSGGDPRGPSAVGPVSALERLRACEARLLDGNYAEAEREFRALPAPKADAPAPVKAVHGRLSLAFSLPALAPHHAEAATATLCRQSPEARALAAALLRHHETAQNGTLVLMLRKSLSEKNEPL